MPLVTLLNADDPFFAWEHANAHRYFLGVMSPLTRFSVIPYFLEPVRDASTPATGWLLDHQQAHNDALTILPSAYLSETVGIDVGTNLLDTNLTDPWNLSWWIFNNHMEHYVGNNAILPPPQPPPPPPPPAPTWTFPFW